MDDPEPDVGTRRKILEVKLEDHRTCGYEQSVNARLSEILGESSEVPRDTSRKHYMAVVELEKMIAALEENGDG